MFRLSAATATLSTLLAVVIPTVLTPIANAQTPNQHAVVLVTPSLDQLQELGKVVPQDAENQIREMLQQFAGPLSALTSAQDPFGLWLDWKQETPNIGLFLASDHRPELHRILDKYNLQSIDAGDGIYEIKAGNTIYYRESGNWLLLSGDRQDLIQPFDPTPYVQSLKPHALKLHVVMPKIPVSSRAAIAQVAATRMLPTPYDASDEISSERLIHWYGQRVIDQLFQQSETITVAVGTTKGHLSVHIDAEGSRLRSATRDTASAHLPQVAETPHSVRFHLSLSDEEIAMINWWSASLADQVFSSTEQADIQDRSGVEALANGARVVSQLLRKTVQSGQVEGYLQKIETDEGESVPLIGVRVKDGEWFANELRQWATSPDAKNLSLRDTEWSFESVQNVSLHRLTFTDESDELTTIVIAIAPEVLYVTSGKDGLKSLRRVLESTSADKGPVRPLSLVLPDVGFERFFGWSTDQNGVSPLTGIHLTSEYTAKGMQFDIHFGQQ